MKQSVPSQPEPVSSSSVTAGPPVPALRVLAQSEVPTNIVPDGPVPAMRTRDLVVGIVRIIGRL